MFKKITIIGAGFVGFSLAVLISQKKDVTIFDIDKIKLQKINNKISPIHDNKIQDFLNTKNLRLKTSEDLSESIDNTDLVILALPTDFNETTNSFDTSVIENTIEKILSYKESIPILIKSTVPIGFTTKLRSKHINSNITFSPEFLREGHALEDNIYPSRIIIGSDDDFSKDLYNLFNEFTLNNPKVFFMGSDEAESVKLFSNTYLANRVNFFNELDSFAIEKDLDTKSIIDGVTSDSRIGDGYHNPSFGYGGYCLPKDTKQLLSSFQSIPQKAVTATIDGNQTRKNFLANHINSLNKKCIGIYRLIMKEGSKNFRESAIIDLIKILKKLDPTKTVIIYEPLATDKTMFESEVVKCLEDFKNKSDIIILNRYDERLNDVKHKVFCRDVYGEN